MYEKFGLNAAHPLLPQYTKVEVTHNGKELIVTINNRDADIANESTLELSGEAAKVLDIDDSDGPVPCSIKVSVIENNTFLKFVHSLLPYMGVIFLLGLL